ncbi:MAG: single-stranded DNA-binding protein [Candidatus Komeilibacteria bacterium]
MDLNKVMVIGRLTADPEVRTTPGGDSVVSFSVATNFTWTNKEGNKQEKAEFHNIVAWRKLAEIMAQYLKKGSRVYLDGRLQTRSWEDQNGIKKYRTEIIADNMIMLDSKGSGENFSKTTSEPMAQADTTPVIEEEEINVEDIPF